MASQGVLTATVWTLERLSPRERLSGFNLMVAGKGSFDCVVLRFANANFAQDDRLLDAHIRNELSLPGGVYCRRYHRPSHRHNRALRGIGCSVRSREHFLLNVL